MNQEPRDATDRRSTILMAALECFNQNGIEATPIDEIGRRSGASVGSIYHHFSSKEGIAIALMAEGLRSNAEQLEKRLRGARTARQGVHKLVESLIDWITAHPDWARFIYMVSSNRLAEAGRAQLQAVNEYHSRVVGEYFEPHLKAGAFRRLPQDCIPSLILGPVHDYARRWLNGQVTSNITDHGDLFANAAWNAVRKT